MRQIAALPYATGPDGSMRILLITSRDTRRWVIPKGNRIKGMAGHRAAELEAYEEAGIHGIACPAPLGRYRYDKKRRRGDTKEATVEVFPLAVTGQRSEEHTSELQSLMRISYAAFCLKKHKKRQRN